MSFLSKRQVEMLLSDAGQRRDSRFGFWLLVVGTVSTLVTACAHVPSANSGPQPSNGSGAGASSPSAMTATTPGFAKHGLVGLACGSADVTSQFVLLDPSSGHTLAKSPAPSGACANARLNAVSGATKTPWDRTFMRAAITIPQPDGSSHVGFEDLSSHAVTDVSAPLHANSSSFSAPEVREQQDPGFRPDGRFYFSAGVVGQLGHQYAASSPDWTPHVIEDSSDNTVRSPAGTWTLYRDPDQTVLALPAGKVQGPDSGWGKPSSFAPLSDDRCATPTWLGDTALLCLGGVPGDRFQGVLYPVIADLTGLHLQATQSTSSCQPTNPCWTTWQYVLPTLSTRAAVPPNGHILNQLTSSPDGLQFAFVTRDGIPRLYTEKVTSPAPDPLALPDPDGSNVSDLVGWL